MFLFPYDYGLSELAVSPGPILLAEKKEVSHYYSVFTISHANVNVIYSCGIKQQLKHPPMWC